jgi:transcriptional regulator with XRE-family HTH domain
MRVLANPLPRLDNSPMNWSYIRTALTRLRDEKGWSDNQLAEKSGVPQPTISRFFAETSESMMLDTLSALTKALGVTVAEVIGEKPIEIDDKTRRVMKAMQEMADYKKDVVVSTAETLARQTGENNRR